MLCKLDDRRKSIVTVAKKCSFELAAGSVTSILNKSFSTGTVPFLDFKNNNNFFVDWFFPTFPYCVLLLILILYCAATY